MVITKLLYSNLHVLQTQVVFSVENWKGDGREASLSGSSF